MWRSERRWHASQPLFLSLPEPEASPEVSPPADEEPAASSAAPAEPAENGETTESSAEPKEEAEAAEKKE